LGDFEKTNTVLINNHPSIPLLSMTTGEVVNPSAPKNTPDTILTNGKLQSGAAASVTVRKTTKPVDELGLRWLISGTKGEIEVTMKEAHLQQAPPGRRIRLRKGKDEVEVFEFDKVEEPGYISNVAQTGINTARLYEDIATGKDGFADFEQACRLHRLLHKMVKESGYEW
jgi:predicted dehydrogenase